MAVQNDPVEQYLDAGGRSVSSSLHCSCYFPSGARGLEDVQKADGQPPCAVFNETDRWSPAMSSSPRLLCRTLPILLEQLSTPDRSAMPQLESNSGVPFALEFMLLVTASAACSISRREERPHERPF